MCGVGGYILHAPARPGPAALETLRRALGRRGPDDEGVCLIDRASGRIRSYAGDRTVAAAAAHLPHIAEAGADPHDVALVHTRFAIIDRSEGGHQPFQSSDGSVVGIFQGEIFNYVELRHELASRGATFHTQSDTEVLIEGFRAWGHDVWRRLNGFWAVALFSRTDHSVVLCRDRFGVAPLYCRQTPEGMYFSSLIRPLLEVAPPDPGMRYETVQGFVDTELKDFDDATCYDAVQSLPPGVALQFAPSAAVVREARAIQFWDYPPRPLTREDLSFGEAVTRFRETFMDAVAIRLRADVPVACELSGGLDSSSVVAAAAQHGRTITTYTVRVPENNEEPYARTLTRRYRLDYRVIDRPEADFFADAAAFMHIMEEPFHSPNVYTHYKTREIMHRDGIRVVLAGSGGDEVLAGYEQDFWPQARRAMRGGGQRLQALMYGAQLHTRTWRGARRMLFNNLKSLRPYRAAARTPAQRAPRTEAERHVQRYATLDFHAQRLYHMQIGLLPYYLRSDDHFSLALPVEQRSPFLDYRIVELGLQLPPSYLFRRGWTKYLLRRAMEPYLPQEVVWRRDKMGFPFPLRPFLREHRDRLAPFASRAAEFLHTPPNYEELLQTDAKKLWRLCATGLWLELD